MEALSHARVRRAKRTATGTDEERGLPPMQLYDLDTDPREARNLIGEHPDIAQRLQAMLKHYEATGRTRQP